MKTLLLVSNSVMHYRVSIYNYFWLRLKKYGWEFKVISDQLQPKNQIEVKFEFWNVPFNFHRYRVLINEIRPDVVILYLHLKDSILWPLMHWLKFKKIPVIFWTKGANLDRPNSKVRYCLFNYIHGLSDALIMYSANQKEFIKSKYRYKAFVANNTINFEDFPEIWESKEEIKSELNIPFQKVVLFVGTMGVHAERKKVEHLIRVFNEIDREDVGLLIVGSGMSTELQERLNQKNSRYFGEVYDSAHIHISKLFKAADLFVVPGHLGLGLNQAFFWGLPVITEEGLHPPEIQYLHPGRNGFFVPENDLPKLKERILYLLDNDSLREEFSRNARKDILREASIENMFDGFKHCLDFIQMK